MWRRRDAGAHGPSCLQAKLGSPPVSPLGVVPEIQAVQKCQKSPEHCREALKAFAHKTTFVLLRGGFVLEKYFYTLWCVSM